MKTIDVLIESAGVSLEQLATVTDLPVERVEAIVEGRWLPRPAERAATSPCRQDRHSVTQFSLADRCEINHRAILHG